jgi:hypothetical protein
MPIKREQIIKPVLPVEELVIVEIGPDPVLVHALRQRVIMSLQDKATAANVAWDIALIHEGVRAEDGEPVYTLNEWEDFQAANRKAYKRIIDRLAILNGLAPDENEKN